MVKKKINVITVWKSALLVDSPETYVPSCLPEHRKIRLYTHIKDTAFWHELLQYSIKEVSPT